jgi:predicted ATPase
VQLHVSDAATWRIRLLNALGSNAGVLTDVLPELSRLLGEVPPPPPLNATETQQRFQRVFVDFVAALAPPQSPLTLFVDDVQWSAETTKTAAIAAAVREAAKLCSASLPQC